MFNCDLNQANLIFLRFISNSTQPKILFHENYLFNVLVSITNFILF